MVVQLQRITYSEFEAFTERPENQERRFELIDGVIVEKMPTELHGFIVALLTSALFTFVQSRGLGRVTTEVRYRIPGDEHHAYIPDISFRANVTDPIVTQGAVPVMPDLAIEVKSPDDSLRDMRAKADYYLANGSTQVWLVLPEQQLVEVYTRTEDKILTANDMLTGGDLLPGFSIAVREVFNV